jgi:hypothetical protein
MKREKGGWGGYIVLKTRRIGHILQDQYVSRGRGKE